MRHFPFIALALSSGLAGCDQLQDGRLADRGVRRLPELADGPRLETSLGQPPTRPGRRRQPVAGGDERRVRRTRRLEPGSLGLLVVLLAAAVANPHLAIAAALTYALAYTAELGLSLVVYFGATR